MQEVLKLGSKKIITAEKQKEETLYTRFFHTIFLVIAAGQPEQL